MKKLSLIIISILLFSLNSHGQYLINQSHYTPLNIENIPRSFSTSDGGVFNGTETRGNGIFLKYQGTITYPNGARFDGTLDQQRRCTGGYYYEGNKTWRVAYRDGVLVEKVDLNAPSSNGGSSYSGGSYGGNTYGGSTGSSGYTNPVDNHTAVCRGCNGSGLCQHCNGSGISSSGKSKCSLCHGRGKCVSCGGRGKIRL